MKLRMKLTILILFAMIFVACNGQQKSRNNAKNTIVENPNDLKVGGLYVFQSEDKTYYITKILAIDSFAVHVRTYSDIFTSKPNEINSDKLKILIGHAPIDKNGFLIDKPELLSIETVKETELEGYKMYLDAMKQ